MTIPDYCNFCSEKASWYAEVKNSDYSEQQVFFCERHGRGWTASLSWLPANELPQEKLV